MTCCVGTELHEMGMRMISDLFEYNGWDSIYLGAGVPKSAIMSAVRENNPKVVALSVTMPQHLTLCLEYVNAIRKEFQDVKIAVGGRAFLTSDKLWEKWDIDCYADNALNFVQWANKTFKP